MSKKVMIDYDSLLKAQKSLRTILNALEIPNYHQHIKSDLQGEYTALESFLNFKDSLSSDIKTLEEFTKTVETIENKQLERLAYAENLRKKAK